MAPSLTWQVDPRDGLTIVTVNGTVDARSGPALCHALTRCLESEPGAVVIDLSGASVADAGSAGTFTTILGEAERWPGTPVLLCAPDAATAGVITAAAGEAPPLYATVAGALSALTGSNEVVTQVIPPVPGAARRAREVVTECCRRWDIPELVAPATLVASELVTNAVMHAHTAMTLHFALRPRHLFLAVIDGSSTEPVPRGASHPGAVGGRGLHLVDMSADRWDHQQHRDGKVVWARFSRRGTEG